MSKRSIGQPVDGPVRPPRRPAGRPPLLSLLRFDKENDPAQGLPLYEAVVSQDKSHLTDDGWLDRLDAIGRLKCRLAALEAETIAGFDDSLHGVSADLGHRHPEPGDRAATAGERRWIAGDLRSVSDEIAGIIEMRRGSATTRIHRSCELVHNFPATLAALSEGLLTERAAFTIVAELSVLDDLGELRAAEAAILDWARTHPLVDIKQECQREVARRCPEAIEKAYQGAHDKRSVQMCTDDVGRAHLIHDHDAVDAAAVMTSLSRAAISRRRQGDTRTLDQLRNDIALSRLLPRSKRPTPAAAASEPPPTHKPADNNSTTATTAADTGIPTTTPEDTNPAGAARARTPAATPEDTPADGADTAHTPATATDAEGTHPAGAAAASTPPAATEDTHADGADTARTPATATEGRHPDDAATARTRAATGEDAHSEGAATEEPSAASAVDPGPTGDCGSWPDRDMPADRDVMDETAIGADATVVIHATGAEIRALINSEVATGGEADHHGPIPQSSLRKHLLRALAQTLVPDRPTTPNRSSNSGAAAHRAPTTNADPRTACADPHIANADPRTANAGPHIANAGPHAASAGPHAASADPRTTSAEPRTTGSGRRMPSADPRMPNNDAGMPRAVIPNPGSRIELQITDEPPPSNPDRYTPSPALDRYVRLRDRTCQFPGCNRPAEFTDVDHRSAFAAGGRTTAANLGCLCRHHHRLKHEGGWHIRPNPDGSSTWISPIGRNYPNNRAQPIDDR
ncbi:DUF222 domain-containing protein [Kribbella sp. NPDC051620]|uniref:HNH endonuclease signature motif containing protein n=1 Tax=Kribbella sp. NPDC051620 TaxID=3364120 RepID=UPI0037B5ACE3